MFIWDFEVTTKWSFTAPEEDGDAETYVVSGNTFEKAFEKVKKLALSPKRKFVDEETNKIHKPVSIELIRCERKEWIDA